MGLKRPNKKKGLELLTQLLNGDRKRKKQLNIFYLMSFLMHGKKQLLLVKTYRVQYLLLFATILIASCDDKPHEDSYKEKMIRIDERVASISDSLQITVLNDSTFEYTLDYQTTLPGKSFITEFYIDDIFLYNDSTYIQGNLFLDNSFADLYFRFVINSDVLTEIKTRGSKQVIAQVYIERVSRITFKLWVDNLDKYALPEIKIDWLSNPILIDGVCLRIFEL